MADLADQKYPEQIAHLRENYGFSQTHANALVMYSRGSKSSKRFATPTKYFQSLEPTQAKTVKAIFSAITLCTFCLSSLVSGCVVSECKSATIK